MNLVRLCIAMALFAAAMTLSGCCGPCGGGGMIGPGCMAGSSCGDCSGATTACFANGPVDALRTARRRMVCGSGCGEAYLGEWISTPPDSSDPCCGDQFVGGATKCQPYCWERGTLLRGLYGTRFCSPAASSTPCGGDCGCSTVCDRVQARRSARAACRCEACSAGVDETYAEEPVISHEVSAPISSGCSSGTCQSCSKPRGTTVAKAKQTASSTR